MPSIDHNAINRIETKLTRFAEELGVNIVSDPDWLTVNDSTRTVYISTLGRSLSVMLHDMKRQGATKVGQYYDIIHRGDAVGQIVFRDIQ